MNAGGSPAGQRFAAKEADIAFVSVEKHDAETVKSRVDALRRLAYDEFKRPVQVWNSSYVVCRPTEKGSEGLSQLLRQRKGRLGSCREVVRIFRMQSLALPKPRT